MEKKLEVGDLVHPRASHTIIKYGRILNIIQKDKMEFEADTGKMTFRSAPVAVIDWLTYLGKRHRVGETWLENLSLYEKRNHPLTKIFQDEKVGAT